ncbi:probable serine/threonine-protein kinase roco6 [Mytilus trossulus]|uniref:probable serine/threonine-protein kinase roco6 n=1 Tax=Mytilus trossulus TaxID=6551 RepID=UPI0030060D92
MRRLLWGTKDQSSSTQSTDGIDIKKCNINIEDGSWSPCNTIDHDLARLIQQVYTEKKENKNETTEQNIEDSYFGQKNSSFSSDDSKADIHQALVLQKKMTNDEQMEVSTKSCQDKTDQTEVFESSFNVGISNFTEDSSDMFDTSVDKIKEENTNNFIDESKENGNTMNDGKERVRTNKFKRFENNPMKSNEVENERDIQSEENIAQMTNSIMQSCVHRNANDSHDMSAFCALWDFAGQKDFYATHQVFLSKCAVFLLVTDSLESSCAEKLWIDFQDTAQYVRFWFDAIHCYWSTTKENRLDPPIIVVCTNEDKIKDPHKRAKRQDKFKKNLSKILKEQQKEHLRNIHFVSNIENDDLVFEEIRKEISSLAMTMKDWGRDCPLKWLLFQQVIERLKNSQVPIATTANLLTIAKHDSIGIHNDDEFKRCLQYFNDIGTVIYFDAENLKDHVILDSKWLIDAFRCLVSDKIEFSIELSNDWQTLRETGELTSVIIRLLFRKEPKLKFLENEKHLVEVMKRFDIIVKLLDSNALYMPCMMDSCSFNKVKKKLMNKNQTVNITSWLCLEFEFLPPAFFNHIIAWYIKHYHVSAIHEQETRTNRKALYRQIGVFDLDISRCQQLVVCEGPNVVALQIHQKIQHSDHQHEGGRYQINIHTFVDTKCGKLLNVMNKLEHGYEPEVF